MLMFFPHITVHTGHFMTSKEGFSWWLFWHHNCTRHKKMCLFVWHSENLPW